MPKGGFGNLIALPLQKHPRDLGRSVFVDADLQPLPDQWEFLESIRPLPQATLETTLTKLVGDRHHLDIAYADVPDENSDTPWILPAKPNIKLTGVMPKAVLAAIAGQLFIEKAGLPQPLMNRLIRLAAFHGLPPVARTHSIGIIQLSEVSHASIQEVIRLLAEDSVRNAYIIADAISALRDGRKILLLTKRTEHLDLLYGQLKNIDYPCFLLHGRMKAKERQIVINALAELPQDTPHILLASAQLVGEGFDHAPLDTLIFTLPIPWEGTLQQYAGRLHRDHVGKTDILIHDYVELDHPQLSRMWEKRQRGYRVMGYSLGFDQQQSSLGYTYRP